ncbi:MAG TPA: hypothetical protein PLD05_00305 [Thermogutta sp.]|nr:hypothetical protein [Thermogutta sp.]HPU04994.1 hypothetical protein [Thermogutta sp.]
MTRCLLLINEPGSGPWNMAMDEFCATHAEREDVPILRLYRWREPTLSLGYFQRYQDYQRHRLNGLCPVVRRPSGGGAILHDLEWTYSLAFPTSRVTDRDRLSFYRAVHQTILTWLDSLGLKGEIIQEQPPPCKSNNTDCAFLCFQRRAVGDVVVPLSPEMHTLVSAGATGEPVPTDVKIVGSAQRRYKNTVLQHGSILLGRSVLTPELPGVMEILASKGIQLTHDEISYHFVSHWPQTVARALGWRLQPWTLSLTDSPKFAELEAKYLSRAWTCKSQA